MKVLISYFSLGGTTRTVAEEVATAMSRDGHEVDLHRIGSGAPPDIAEYDALGVGSPAHFFRPPEPVRKFIDALPQLHGMPFFTIVLHGTVVGDAGNWVRKWVAEKGGQDVGYFSTKGKDLWLGYLRRGRLFSPDGPKSQDLRAAHAFAREVTERLESDRRTDRDGLADNDPPPGFIYRMERLAVHPSVVQKVYTRLFKATDACTGCGECLEACPLGNVSPATDTRPVWGQDCIFCLNCELRCPEDAVRSAADLPVMAPFMQYNIRKALADPDIASAPVEFREGTIRRLD